MEDYERTEDDERTEITLGLSREEAFAFLVRLAEDDEFRAALEANPRAELERNGISISTAEDDVPATLPPKEEVRGLLQKLAEPDEFGGIPPEAVGWGCYVVLWRIGFAMPFIRNTERDGAR